MGNQMKQEAIANAEAQEKINERKDGLKEKKQKKNVRISMAPKKGLKKVI